MEYLRTLDMLKEHGWSASRRIPHGGHQMSLNIAAGLGLGGNESYPDLFQPFGGLPDGVKVENGFVTMPDLPEGLAYAREFVSREEERSLIALIRSLPLQAAIYKQYTARCRRARSMRCAGRRAGAGSTAWRRWTNGGGRSR